MDNFQVRTHMLYLPYKLSGPQLRNTDTYGTFTSMQALLDLSYAELKTGEKLLPTTTNIIEWLSVKYVS